jgi:rubrerythrin
MKNKEMEAVIRRAIANEEDAYQFYLRLAQRVADESAKETLRYLAREEQGHKEYLLHYREKSFMDNAVQAADETVSGLADLLGAPAAKENMDSKEVYLLAAEKELNAYKLYKGWADLHPAGEIRDMLLKMAAEELKHKEKVEYLYANAAFVQTDGG